MRCSRVAAMSLACVVAAILTPRVDAQNSRSAGRKFASLGDLQKAYADRDLLLKKQQIADLDALTTHVKGEEAEAAYRQLFGLAMAHDLYNAAEPAARRYAKAGKPDSDLHVLAILISLIDMADRGQYKESLKELEAVVKKRREGSEAKLSAQVALALGEAYLQKLTKGGRYDIAKQVCELGMTHPDTTIQTHFKARLARFEQVGTAAPDLSGKNIDGDPVQLSEFKGKVVLVDFWATWCPPCVSQVPYYSALRAKYGAKGFEIVGVNLDSEREDLGGDPKKAAPIVRNFLLTYRVAWPNIVGTSDHARKYGVTDIPATFLVDRSGKIIHVEANGTELEKAISDAVK